MIKLVDKKKIIVHKNPSLMSFVIAKYFFSSFKYPIST
jgi:hypothetical protein